MASDPLAPLLDLPGVADAVAAGRAAVDRLLTHKVLRRRSAQVSAESALRGARASAALAGADFPLAAFRAGDFGEDPLARGALRLSAELGPLSAAFARAPRQALARMHALAAADLLAPDALGRPRAAGVVPAAEEPGLPPAAPPFAVAARLDTLASVVGSSAPAAVVAAVVHGELLALRPFAAGNGLVARCAARCVLVGRGLDPKAVTVPEVGHLELAADYPGALAGFASGERSGLAAWLVHCARALELGAREGLAVAESVARESA